MYVDLFMHTHMHVNTYIYLYTYIYIYVCTHAHEQAHLRVYMPVVFLTRRQTSGMHLRPCLGSMNWALFVGIFVLKAQHYGGISGPLFLETPKYTGLHTLPEAPDSGSIHGVFFLDSEASGSLCRGACRIGRVVPVAVRKAACFCWECQEDPGQGLNVLLCRTLTYYGHHFIFSGSSSLKKCPFGTGGSEVDGQHHGLKA